MSWGQQFKVEAREKKRQNVCGACVQLAQVNASGRLKEREREAKEKKEERKKKQKQPSESESRERGETEREK